MKIAVFIKTFDPPPVNRREILRYAGVGESAPEIETLLDECLQMAQDKLRFQVCWDVFPVSLDGERLNLGFADIRSRSLAVNLQGCESIVLFAATVGVELDRLIARQARISPVKAHMLQAIGSERIESLCDAFNEEITQAYGCTRPRFSPGYGDVPLAVQKDVFRTLQCSKHIGVTLNENLFMSPSKSVTAIIGIRRKA